MFFHFHFSEHHSISLMSGFPSSVHSWQHEGLCTPVQAEYPSSVSAMLRSPSDTNNGSPGLSPYRLCGPQSVWPQYDLLCKVFSGWGARCGLLFRCASLSPPLLLNCPLTQNYFFLEYLNFISVPLLIKYLPVGGFALDLQRKFRLGLNT